MGSSVQVNSLKRKECESPSFSAAYRSRSTMNNGYVSGQGNSWNRKKNDATSFFRKQSIAQSRASLPIASAEKRLIQEVKDNNTLLIIGETGSGKTTQLPQFLLTGGFCCDGRIIGVTQPRRVAAITVAKRVAEECGVELGQKVGYSIRFEDVTSSHTRIKYMTDGILLREALSDPLLSRYSVIIIDEAHERTVHTDVLLGLVKNVQKRRLVSSLNTDTDVIPLKGNDFNGLVSGEKSRKLQSADITTSRNSLPPLKLIVMSASLDASGFFEYLGGAKALRVQGRQHPVKILYTYRPEPDYVDAVLITIFQIHLEEEPGDILVFLTGQEEIESVDRMIRVHANRLPEDSQKILTVSIYSSLPSEQQMQVFRPAPSGVRKVILATNIAETSITIPNIKYVIDPGLVKIRNCSTQTGMDSLDIVPISKAQALQRSGRAGREGPGKCFRLYTEDMFGELADSAVPEIKRCSLSSVVLQLKAMGIDDILGFDFLDKPPRDAILKSLHQLYLLGALTIAGKLSDPVGVQMARLPLDPIHSKSLIMACTFNCLEEMLISVAMLSVESIFFSPRANMEEAKAAKRSFSSSDGDHVTLVNVFRSAVDMDKSEIHMNHHNKSSDKKLLKWCKDNFINNRSLKHAMNIHRQIRQHVVDMGLKISSCGNDILQFRRCLAASFFLSAAAKQPDGTYLSNATKQTVKIHPSSVLFGTKPDCVIFNELVKTKHNYIRNISPIDRLWLPEFAREF